MQLVTSLQSISAKRWTKLFSGLFSFGMGAAFMKRADLGLPPWEVLNDGVAYHTGIMLGTASIVVGLAIMLLWIPMRLKPDVGTIFNIFLVGLFTNLVLSVVCPIGSLAIRALALVLGIACVGIGSTLYLGSHLGAGPRDGLMVGLHFKTGVSLSRTRTSLEIVVLAVGYSLHGSAGPGTLLFALTIGPVIQRMMKYFGQSLRPSREERHEDQAGGSGRGIRTVTAGVDGISEEPRKS